MISRWVLAIGVIVALTIGLSAQDATPDQKRIAALEAQIKKMATVPPADAVKAAQAQLTRDLQALRDQIAPGCKAIGGKWAIVLDGTGKVTSVTCTEK